MKNLTTAVKPGCNVCAINDVMDGTCEQSITGEWKARMGKAQIILCKGGG